MATQAESDAFKQTRLIKELGELCVSMNLSRKHIHQMHRIDRQCMYNEVQYLLDHRLSMEQLERAFNMKGFLE